MGFTENNGMYMPVAPAGYGYGNGGFGGFGGDGAWWLLVLLFAMGGWGNGYGMGNGGAIPYMAMNTNNDVQRGFDQAAVTTGLNTIQQSVCDASAGIVGAINAGFAGAEAAASARQIADMQQQFALQSQFAQCCCDNKLATSDLKATVLSENCSDRYEAAQNTQAILTAISQGFQNMSDQRYQDKIDSKNEEISNLRQQLLVAQLQGNSCSCGCN